MPTEIAASTRAWPATIPSKPSIRTGLMNPNSWMLAAICWICRELWVRGFFGRAFSFRGSLYLMLSVPTVTSTAKVRKHADRNKIANQIQGSFPCYSRESCLIRKIYPCSCSQGKAQKCPSNRSFWPFAPRLEDFSAFFPVFFPVLRARSWRLVRHTLCRQPVKLPFGEYLSKTLEIPANRGLSALSHRLWMAEFPILAPKIRNGLSLLPRELPFSEVTLRRPKNKHTAWGR